MSNDIYHIGRGNGEAASNILDELTELYVKVYAEPPYNSGSLYSREDFVARTTRQAANQDFAISWARSSDGELVGYSFGFLFAAGRWWAGNASPPPSEVLESPKFAVIELIVDAMWRGRGVGKDLLGEVLKQRTEKFAILTADPDAPARRIYERWGWEQIGTAKHTDEAPTMDQLLLRR